MQFTSTERMQKGITHPELGQLTIVLKGCDAIDGVVNEYVGAVLADYLGFNVPPFFILWRGDSPYFASTFIPSETVGDMRARTGFNPITDSPQFKARMDDFDSFITNGDRHDGNILVANDSFYLIDHERAFDAYSVHKRKFKSPSSWINATLRSSIDSLWMRFYNEFRHNDEAIDAVKELHNGINRVM